jgi:hypothetical protein
MTPYQHLSAQLRARSAEPQPVLPPRDYEPHCLMAWEVAAKATDEMAEYALKHKELK